MDKKKIGAGFAGALQKAADATKAAKLAVQDMAADAKQSREKKKADAQKAASAKELIAAAESEKGTAPEVKSNCLCHRPGAKPGRDPRPHRPRGLRSQPQQQV